MTTKQFGFDLKRLSRAETDLQAALKGVRLSGRLPVGSRIKFDLLIFLRDRDPYRALAAACRDNIADIEIYTFDPKLKRNGITSIGDYAKTQIMQSGELDKEGQNAFVRMIDEEKYASREKKKAALLARVRA